jgi:acetyl-CoA carboxylase biotin carboxyl carrier protein
MAFSSFALANWSIPIQGRKVMPDQKSNSPASSSANLDLSEITQIVDLMAKNDITFFQLEREDASIQMRRGHDLDALKDLLAKMPAPQAPIMYGAPAQMAAPAPAAIAAPAVAAPAAKADAPAALGPTVNSPMVGTFYLSAAPGEKKFIQIGDQVNADTTVCIIEAMKVMNEIKAETSGTIVRVLVEDGKPVQYNQPLFELK